MAFVSLGGGVGFVGLPSGGGNLALAGIALARGARGGRVLVACKARAGGRGDMLSGQAAVKLRLILSGDAATLGGRKVVLACRAVGLHGGDSPLDPEKLSLPELLDFLAKYTLMMLERVNLPKPEGLALRQLGNIQAECEKLVHELTEGRISCHTAAIKLLGLHARICTLFTFCRAEQDPEWSKYLVGAPATLEESSMEGIRLSMLHTKNDFYDLLKNQPNEVVHGRAEAASTLSELLVILVKQTTLIVHEMPGVRLPRHGTQDVSLTLGEVMTMSRSWELQDLQLSCRMLDKEMGADLPDHVAVGTLFGLHTRLRSIFTSVAKCFYSGKVDGPLLLHDTLKMGFRGDLLTSMSQAEECMQEYARVVAKSNGAAMPKQLESAAEKTLLMLNQVEQPKGCSTYPEKWSVAVELPELRAGCEGLMSELAAGKISDHEASITLLGLHGRVDILLSFCLGGDQDDKGLRAFPGSLEASSQEALKLSVRKTEFLLESAKYLVTEPKQQDQNNVGGPSAPATQSFTELINTLAKKTIFLLTKVSKVHLSNDATNGERMSVVVELNTLRDRCKQLAEEVVKAQVSDSVAIGTFLGIHARFRVVFNGCIDVHDGCHPDLEASIKEALVTTMTYTEQRVENYVKDACQETIGEAAEEVE